ncbi:MAG: c-type cytochrome [Thermoanaerobaculia bacterium]|nr:c-type cytochrome [Thermoanaerobaculia bacterium]
MRKLVLRLLLLAASALGVKRALKTSRSSGSGPLVESDDLIGPFRKRDIKRWIIEVAVIFAVMGGFGFLVAASGIIPIKASAGHWTITKWFLSFSMERSVSLHARGIEVPDDLDDPAKILRGAGHYETACSSCHGIPSLKKPRIASELTPEPPYLPDVISLWEPAELFYIVKHGVKMTGMPAWPARERDDEVWSVVAFLLRFPEMDEAGYHELVWGDSLESSAGASMTLLTGPDRVPEEIARSCARCHGSDGMGRGIGAFPTLAGQKPTYLFNSLRAYARGERNSGIMQPIAAGLSETTMRDLARYYSSIQPAQRAVEIDKGSVNRGREIVLNGIRDEKIPSCTDCHSPGAKDAYPLLGGQYESYIVRQLELFAEKKRGGSGYAHLMHPIAPKLTGEQRKDVAAYFESLGR